MMTIQLTDAVTQSEAGIVTQVGNNVYRYTVHDQPVILSPPKLSLMKEAPFAPFQYGSPILFPPNRVKNAAFSYKGRTYRLPENEPPHHLHGEMCMRGWKVVEYGASESAGAFVTSEFRITDHPDILSYFPHPLTFTVTHRLKDGKLYCNGSVANEGDEEAPFAFGLHPYFSVPFDEEEEIELTVPATQEWPVTSQAFVTGEPAESAFSRKLSGGGVSITDYPRLGCSLLSLDDQDHHTKISLKNRGLTIHYKFDRKFKFAVLFRPDWAPAFSIEPYTCVTDAFNLPYERRMTGAGGIYSGETKSFETVMWVEKE